jgi:hypothetical protein
MFKDCDRQATRRGLCDTHAQAYRRLGLRRIDIELTPQEYTAAYKLAAHLGFRSLSELIRQQLRIGSTDHVVGT